MADAILRRRLSDEARALFFTPTPGVVIIESHAKTYSLAPEEGGSTETGWSTLADFQTVSITQLAAQSGLLEVELLNLLTTPETAARYGLADCRHWAPEYNRGG